VALRMSRKIAKPKIGLHGEAAAVKCGSRGWPGAAEKIHRSSSKTGGAITIRSGRVRIRRVAGCAGSVRELLDILTIFGDMAYFAYAADGSSVSDRVLLIEADARQLPLRERCAERVQAIEALAYLNSFETAGLIEFALFCRGFGLVRR
jgi:hypothetical protein